MNPYSPPTEKPPLSANGGDPGLRESEFRDEGTALAVPGSSVHQWLLIGAFLYPVVFVGSLYVTWFVAWATLGNAPRPNVNDPKSISLGVDLFYNATMVLMIAFPAAAVGGVFLIAMAGLRRRFSGLGTAMVLIAFAALWAGAIMLLRADPWDVATWYMD